jgi:drug/metabolite transporter (DMT)-like permease
MMLRGAVYGLLAAAIWGGMYVVSDVVLPIIPPFTLLSIRLILAVMTLSVWILPKKMLSGMSRRNILQLLFVGLVGYGISVGAQFVGTDKSTAINGTLITSASPAFILVFAFLILGEKLTLQRIIAITLATIGVVVIINPATADFGSDTFFGNVALLVAAVTWGLFSVLIRKVSQQNDTMVVTWLGFLGGMLLTLPASALELQTRPIGTIDFPIVLGILYLGVVSTAGAMWWWNRAFALVPASIASLFFFAQPLVGTILSVMLLGQAMTTALWIGSGLIVVGVLVALFERRTSE